MLFKNKGIDISRNIKQNMMWFGHTGTRVILWDFPLSAGFVSLGTWVQSQAMANQVSETCFQCAKMTDFLSLCLESNLPYLAFLKKND